MTVKKIIGKIHLCLGLTSGLLVLFLGITGCLLAFEKEIRAFTTASYDNVVPRQKDYLTPSALQTIAQQALPGKELHSVTYGPPGKAAQVAFYHFEPTYYYIVYINPYTGAVMHVKDMDRDFFRVVTTGHYYLWLPPAIGQPIVATGTLIFVIMLITGLVLWWPKNKAARRQRFSIKWNARWRRVNYDLHNVLGFYATWIALFLGLTGLVFGFQWFADAVYWTTSGGEKRVAYYEPVSATYKDTVAMAAPAIDQVWYYMQQQYPHAQKIEVHYPLNDSAAVGAAANPDANTYWQTDYRYFDQHTLKELPVTHAYGRFNEARLADKIGRMNYDIHTGAVLGLPGEILAFLGSLVAASLPLTGFMIWRGRRKKKAK